MLLLANPTVLRADGKSPARFQSIRLSVQRPRTAAGSIPKRSSQPSARAGNLLFSRRSKRSSSKGSSLRQCSTSRRAL